MGANDPFSEFGEFGDEFGGGMEDIEKARKAVTFEEDKDRTERDSLQVYMYMCTHIRHVHVLYNNTCTCTLYMYIHVYTCTALVAQMVEHSSREQSVVVPPEAAFSLKKENCLACR